MVLIDTNILLDVLSENQRWADWSFDVLLQLRSEDSLAINDIVYAEMAAGFDHIDDLDNAVTRLGLTHAPIPRGALYLAGRAFRDYRKRSGVKSGVLPDFFIGAHAAVAGMRLVTRDVSRIRTYFPSVELVSP